MRCREHGRNCHDCAGRGLGQLYGVLKLEGKRKGEFCDLKYRFSGGGTPLERVHDHNSAAACFVHEALIEINGGMQEFISSSARR